MCGRDLARGPRERYRCAQCNLTWIRIGGLYEPDVPEADEALPVARVVSQGGDQSGLRSACCDAVVEDVGVERIACTTCKREYVRVGIHYVPA